MDGNEVARDNPFLKFRVLSARLEPYQGQVTLSKRKVPHVAGYSRVSTRVSRKLLERQQPFPSQEESIVLLQALATPWSNVGWACEAMNGSCSREPLRLEQIGQLEEYRQHKCLSMTTIEILSLFVIDL